MPKKRDRLTGINYGSWQASSSDASWTITKFAKGKKPPASGLMRVSEYEEFEGGGGYIKKVEVYADLNKNKTIDNGDALLGTVTPTSPGALDNLQLGTQYNMSWDRSNKIFTLFGSSSSPAGVGNF